MIDRTQLIALILMLRMRCVVLVFALSWAVWMGQVFSGGVEVWGLGLKVVIWGVKKILKWRKERGDVYQFRQR